VIINTFIEEQEAFNLELKAHGRVQYDLGRSAERERIIALLEETAYCGSHNDLIALIKGEN
jgi:hypothetical protein